MRIRFGTGIGYDTVGSQERVSDEIIIALRLSLPRKRARQDAAASTIERRPQSSPCRFTPRRPGCRSGHAGYRAVGEHLAQPRRFVGAAYRLADFLTARPAYVRTSAKAGSCGCGRRMNYVKKPIAIGDCGGLIS
jgi:hypothetical protein